MSLHLYLECPCCGADAHTMNVTHNLTVMARGADLYKPLWRPEECGIAKASDLIEPLERGIKAMREDPERFKAHNPPNGWGTYDGFLKALDDLLAACREHPDMVVRAWR